MMNQLINHPPGYIKERMEETQMIENKEEKN